MGPFVKAPARRTHIGFWNLSTNSSTGLLGGGWMEKSLESSGCRQKIAFSNELEPGSLDLAA
jgi:hypothetical protein